MPTASQIFSAEIRSAHIEKMFKQAPKTLFPIVRDQTFRLIAGFRKRWLAREQVDFRGGAARNFPLLSTVPTAITSGPRGGDAKKIFFVVTPEKGVPGDKLDSIRAEVFSIAKAWERLEQGGTHRARGGKKTPLPIGVTLKSDGRVKSQWSTPERFKRANKAGKQKVLVAIQNPRSGNTILYWQKPMGRGKQKRYVYLPAYLLVDEVKQPQLLHFYDTWDSEKANRTKVAATMLDKMEKALGRGGSRRG